MRVFVFHAAASRLCVADELKSRLPTSCTTTIACLAWLHAVERLVPQDNHVLSLRSCQVPPSRVPPRPPGPHHVGCARAQYI
jgi:hypothetical protein